MWENKEEMFPTGSIPGTDLTINDLDQYQSVDTSIARMARNMLITSDRVIWQANGDVLRYREYSVWPVFQEEESCLSAFGAKMVQDWYQRKEFSNRQEASQINYGGFNYTGLQE